MKTIDGPMLNSVCSEMDSHDALVARNARLDALIECAKLCCIGNQHSLALDIIALMEESK